MRIYLAIFLILFTKALLAQDDDVRFLKGKVYDNTTKEALPGVILFNIYTGNVTTSDSNGDFEVNMKNEELLEFQMIGYKTSRVRMHSYITAAYYSIGLSPELPPIDIKRDSTFEADSTYWARYFFPELSNHSLTAGEVMSQPWELLSKTYRDKEHLKETFDQYIATKYVDMYFNEKFIKENTPLRGADLDNFLIFYRPSYEFARSLSKYEFMLWVKNKATQYYQQQQLKQIQHQ